MDSSGVGAPGEGDVARETRRAIRDRCRQMLDSPASLARGFESAERGAALEFAWYALPVARLLKGYSWVRERFGGVGPIPEGMGPAAALRNRSYNTRHAALKAALRAGEERSTAAEGYRPPYWMLVSLAREAALTTGAR